MVKKERDNSNKMRETIHTGTPYVELRTGAPHASVMVCVCATLHNPSKVDGGQTKMKKEKLTVSK
jgi:hypothetical protein